MVHKNEEGGSERNTGCKHVTEACTTCFFVAKPSDGSTKAKNTEIGPFYCTPPSRASPMLLGGQIMCKC